MFQSTPLHEGRRPNKCRWCVVPKFQSTPLHEGRRNAKYFDMLDKEFQSTPLHEGRRHTRNLGTVDIRFNPRPYTRGDMICTRQTKHIQVSIHAPTRGATFGQHSRKALNMFQSTPLHEGRLTQLVFLIFRNGFNPRPYTRGDVAIIIN